jgi:hypothetical protein
MALQLWQEEIIAFFYGADADEVIEFYNSILPPEGNENEDREGTSSSS